MHVYIIHFFYKHLQSDYQEKIIRRGGLHRDGLNGIGDWNMVS